MATPIYLQILAALESDNPPVPWSNKELSHFFDLTPEQVNSAVRLLRRKGHTIRMTRVTYRTVNYLLELPDDS